jgi:hypothetical protein
MKDLPGQADRLPRAAPLSGLATRAQAYSKPPPKRDCQLSRGLDQQFRRVLWRALPGPNVVEQRCFRDCPRVTLDLHEIPVEPLREQLERRHRPRMC